MLKLGGPYVEMKSGRRDSKESYAAQVENSIPNHNDTVSVVLSTFQSMGIDTQGTVALLGTLHYTYQGILTRSLFFKTRTKMYYFIGAHSVGRVHCINIVQRLYPTVDPTLDPDYALYLKGRCPSPYPDPNAVAYARNDRETPMVLDNMYYKNILGHKGVLVVDQQLVSDPNTYPFVEKMAADNGYFHDQFAKALLILSQNNPLTGAQGEIRKDCRFLNKN